MIVLLVLLKKSVLHGIDLSACKQNLGGSPPAGYAGRGRAPAPALIEYELKNGLPPVGNTGVQKPERGFKETL